MIKAALAGNPNCGKTTLFNALTGGKAHVGNWPGVTVDKREGVRKADTAEKSLLITDLPGIYSLSPYSPEETVARDFIVQENPDVIVNIVDAGNIERNLYLTTQLLETDCPVVVALNMSDIAKKNGIKIDVEKLSQKLGAPVIPICAVSKEGLDKLVSEIENAAKQSRKGTSALASGSLSKAYAEALKVAEGAKLAHSHFQAAKLLEGGKNADFPAELEAQAKKIRELAKLPEIFDGDFGAAIANERYAYIGEQLSPCVKHTRPADALTLSDRLDMVLTSRLFGLPIFFALMFFVFHVTFGEDLFYGATFGFLEEGLPSPGVWMLGETQVVMGWISDIAGAGLAAVHAAPWVSGLIVDGVLGGLGAILGFLPQIMMLFLFLSILEDSGYMARAAFLMDRILRKFGLSGKAFLPLLMCFGCLVPAMMGSRTLENERERRLTIMLAPFFSCGAKLPIWAMFSMAIFPKNADLVIFAIYSLGILTAIVTAFILKHTILRGEVSPFIMELPAYHLPMVKNISLQLWEKLKIFIKRASTIIAGATVVIWFLSNFNFRLDMVEAASQESILGFLGTLIQPLFIPLGFAGGDIGWKAVVAALTGLIAKEMVVSTMGVLYNPGVQGDALEDEAASTALTASLAALFSPLAAISFMAFNLLSVPCMAAVATAHAEMKSAKWTWITIAFWISTAWIVSFLIYQIGSFLGIGV